MKTIQHFICIILSSFCALAMAEIVPVWSVDVALPGEKTALYLVDADVGEDFFRI